MLVHCGAKLVSFQPSSVMFVEKMKILTLVTLICNFSNDGSLRLFLLLYCFNCL